MDYMGYTYKANETKEISILINSIWNILCNR